MTIIVLLLASLTLPEALLAIRFNSLFGDVSQADTPGSGVYTRLCPTNTSLSDACHLDTGYFSLLTSDSPWGSVHALSTTGGGWFAEAATSTTGLRARSGAGFLNYSGGDFTPVSFTDPPVGYAAASLAWATEDIIIRGPSGEYGQFVPSFLLTGTLSSTHDPATDGDAFLQMQGCASLRATQADPLSPVAASSHCAISTASETVNYYERLQPPNNLTQRFEYNVPIRMSVAISTAITVNDFFASPENLRSDTALSNFYSTLTLDPILILDLNGNPVPGLILESTSGVFTLDARNQTNDVPEPGTLPILALLTLTATLRRMVR